MNELRERRYLSEAIKRMLERKSGVMRQFREGDIAGSLNSGEIGRGLPICVWRVSRWREADCCPRDVDPEAWAAERYEINDGFPEGKLYRSEGGVWTRSKAEADIATKLEQHGQVLGMRS